ncbi:hypothetical protein T08_3209 [Trichinella sp. T8]|nr:hypothetical protein T08_3209 [Trichinella sp. T8]
MTASLSSQVLERTVVIISSTPPSSHYPHIPWRGHGSSVTVCVHSVTQTATMQAGADGSEKTNFFTVKSVVFIMKYTGELRDKEAGNTNDEADRYRVSSVLRT